jgi:hypothetical protein
MTLHRWQAVEAFRHQVPKEFGDKAWNVRFAQSTDEMNLFGDLNSSHSTWSVILTI